MNELVSGSGGTIVVLLLARTYELERAAAVGSD